MELPILKTMKTHLSILTLLLLASFPILAQTRVEQKGYVRSIGRPGNKYGERLEGATIRVNGQHNDVRSNYNGDFTIIFDEATIGVTSYTLSRVRLAGYEVNEKEVIGRQFAVSAKVPHEIVMVSLAVKQAIEDSVTARVDRRYKNEYDRLQREKEQLGEEYRTRLQKLQDEYNKRDQLISDMVERYANTDYAKLDSTAAKINAYIEIGELEKADSIIRSMDVAKMESEYRMVHESNSRLRLEIEKGEKAEDNLCQNLYTAYNGKYEIFAQQFENDSAAYYLEKIVELDTTNVENLLKAGNFCRKYIADFDQAMAHCQSALKIIQEQKGDCCIEIQPIYVEIGNIYLDRGEYETSLGFYEKALEILSPEFEEEENEDLAIIYGKIGEIYAYLSNYDESLEYLLKSHEIIQKLQNTDPYLLGISYGNIACVYSDMDDYDKAKEFFDKALEVYSKNLDKNALPILDVYNNLGDYYLNIRNFELAEECLKRALDGRIMIYGENHPDVATSYINLGILYSRQNRYDDALLYQTKALNTYINIFGGNNYFVANAYKAIGVLLYRKGSADSIEYFQKALDILKILGMENRNTYASIYSDIANVYFRNEKYDKSVEYYMHSIDCYEKLEDSVNIAMCYNSLGMCYGYLEEFENSLSCFKESALYLLAILGEEHPYIVGNYRNIGYIYRKMNKYDEAIEYYQKSLELSLKVYGENHSNTITTIKSIGELLLANGDIKTALDHFLQIKKKYDKYIETSYSGVGYSVTIYGLHDNLNENIFNCYSTLATTIPSYSDTITDFLSTKLFVAQFPGDSTSMSELQGEFYLLQLNRWNMDTTENVFDLNKSLDGKTKNVVLYKDGEIISRNLDKAISFDLILKEVGKEEHDMVAKKLEVHR